MTQPLQMRRGLLVLIAVALLSAGSLGTYVFMSRRAANMPSAAQVVAAPEPAGSGATGDVVITLTPEAVTRAGIEVVSVVASTAGVRLRLPAVVQPNAYRAVVVTPVVAGRISRVLAELGQDVRRGQTLAEIYSPDLAEAQTAYISATAELGAHEQELRRTEKLVEIGAASRQELERIHAEHAAAQTMVQSRRSRLALLGMTNGQIAQLSAASGITATISIPAPLSGTITARTANVGLNVDPAVPLFGVVDLSSVWLVGDLYERDLGRVRLGSPAMVTASAFPSLMLEGKVSYIDPEIKAETRTAQIRVEVPNPGRQLRLGMYVDMQVGEPGAGGAVVIPRAAVQLVGDRAVVYLASSSSPGRYVERQVKLGDAAGDDVQVISGLAPGETVVSKGSFSIRAERDRLGAGASAVAR